jgi:hypothetical protein
MSRSHILRILAYGCLGGSTTSIIALYTFNIPHSSASLIALAIMGGFILQLVAVITTLVLLAGLNNERQHVEKQLQKAKEREMQSMHDMGVIFEQTAVEMKMIMEQHTFSLQLLDAKVCDGVRTVQDDIMIVREIIENLGTSFKQLD